MAGRRRVSPSRKVESIVNFAFQAIFAVFAVRKTTIALYRLRYQLFKNIST